MKPTLILTDISKSYPTPNGPAVVVKNFNLSVKQGEFVSIIGHSGCGKSTVLSMVAGLNPPTSGGIILAGKELTEPGPDRGVVFQTPALLPWMTTLENILLGVDQAFYTASKVERHQIAEYYLHLVGLGDSLDRYPRELSQGMRQRAGIARAFSLSPKLLLLDEPFGMLDSLTRLELQQVLADLWRKNRKTALMITHDVDEAIFLSDRIVMMTDGPEAEVGEIVEIPIDHPRNRLSFAATPFYSEVRDKILGFLEFRAHFRKEISLPGEGSNQHCMTA